MTTSTQTTVDANLNSTQCLKSMEHWGETIVHNVCKGTQQTLEWGFWDWALSVILLLGLVGIVLLVFAFAWRVFEDRW